VPCFTTGGGEPVVFAITGRMNDVLSLAGRKIR